MITYKRTDYLLRPIRATWEEIKGLNDRMLEEKKSNESRSVFLPLFKLKRSANVTSIWTLQISVETLVCRRMEGTIPPPHREGTLCELCVGTRVSGHKGPWDGKSVVYFHTTIKQSKTWSWEQGGVFYIRVLCASCHGEHILGLFISDLTACSSQPLHRTVCALGYKRTVAPVASAKLEKKDTVAWTQNQQCCTDKYI